MDDIRTSLMKRLEYLKRIKKEKEKALKKAPQGTLRINCRTNDNTVSVQYYLRNDSQNNNGTYIPAARKDLVRRLAQKDYDAKIVRTIEKEESAITKYLARDPAFHMEDLYRQLSPERQELVVPVIESDEAFIKNWREVSFSHREIPIDGYSFITDQGEQVRSKSEVIIANALARENVPYRYEYPVYLEGMGTVHPDFTILNVRQRREILWEHLGMMDDPEYAENAVRKLSVYENNEYYPGENLILTWETRTQPLDIRIVKTMIERYA